MDNSNVLDSIDRLKDYVDLQSNKKLDDETIICECFCVNVADIRQHTNGVLNLEELTGIFGLGTGCRSCIKSLDSWRDKI